MPQKTLPPNPDLDHLRHQARDLRRSLRAADPRACQWVREFHPCLGSGDDAAIAAAPFALADALLTVARIYGYSSWANLKATVQKGGVPDPETPLWDRIADPAFRRAVDLIDAGDEAGLRTHLAAHPTLVRRRVYFHAGGYFGKPTLLQFVAENPIRHETMPPNVVAVARVLLDAGADADDGTLGLVATGRVPRECGVQIPLIDLLCDRGAAAGSLGAVLAHGEFAAAKALLRRGAPLDLPTAAALDRLDDARRLLPEADAAGRHLALALAAQHGRTEVVRLLLDAGEDPSRYNPPGAHAHSTPLHQAVVHGHLDTVRLLVERGARTDLKDTLFDGTPLGWAEYAGENGIAEYLRGA